MGDDYPDFDARRAQRDDGALLVEFHEGRTGIPHPPDTTTLRWEDRLHVLPRVGEGVTFPNGRQVVVTDVLHVLGQFRGQHYIVLDVEGSD